MSALPPTLPGARKAFPWPIVLLISANLLSALLTFRGYGISWDEPLFYNYAENIVSAYTPAAFAPGFDFEQVYGRSPADHKYYGPAYLLAARPIQSLLTALGVDFYDAWHLLNFITFQLALLGLYRLARRWLQPIPATLATALLAWQPVFWGHAFINPKDIPFMAAFLWAFTLGIEVVDGLSQASPRLRGGLFVGALALGVASAIRVVGPLAGLLTFLYFLLKWPRAPRAWAWFSLYALLSTLTMIALWPFLWAAPLERLLEVARHMSNNPTQLGVLFMGQVFPADDLPRRYLPQMLALTLTEVVWPLFGLGAIVATRKIWKKSLDFRAPLVTLGLFAGMLGYLLAQQPSMYDGFRHFFFILPPVFVFAGFGLEFLWGRLGRARALLGLALLPGLLGMAQLRPYEYAYYNSLAGGVGGAFRVYETEYWLTCYREGLDWVRANRPTARVYIQREFDVAAPHAAGLDAYPLANTPESVLRPGDLLLFSTRTNLDQKSSYRKLPVIHAVGRDGADFCLIKEKD